MSANDTGCGLRLGRLSGVPTRPRLRLSPFIDHAALAPPPPSVDWYSRVGSWPMYQNDSVGDCVIAEFGHQLGSLSSYAAGAEVTVTDAAIMAMYEAVSGYVPGDPSTDSGCDMQSALSYWRTAGLAGHKLLAFAEVDISNLAEVRQVVAAFGSLDLGHSVCQGDMDAFDAGAPWDTTYPAGPLLGGHSTELAGYDPAGGHLITWGSVQQFTWSWWASRMQEAWLAILPEWLGPAGQSPSGFDLHGLGEEMHALTGDPNPFPAPVPPPPPAGDPDHALWDGEARNWCAGKRTRHDLAMLKAALLAWAAAKGL